MKSADWRLVRTILGGATAPFTPGDVRKRQSFNRAFNHLLKLGCHPKILLWALGNARSTATLAGSHYRKLSSLKREVREIAQRMSTIAHDIDVIEDDLRISPPGSISYRIPAVLRKCAGAYRDWVLAQPKRGQRKDVAVNRIAGLCPSAYVEVVTGFPRHEKVAQLLASLGSGTSQRQLQSEYRELRGKYNPQYDELTAYLRELHKPPTAKDINTWQAQFYAGDLVAPFFVAP
jgi:hypothetical protein